MNKLFHSKHFFSLCAAAWKLKKENYFFWNAINFLSYTAGKTLRRVLYEFHAFTLLSNLMLLKTLHHISSQYNWKEHFCVWIVEGNSANNKFRAGRIVKKLQRLDSTATAVFFLVCHTRQLTITRNLVISTCCDLKYYQSTQMMTGHDPPT